MEENKMLSLKEFLKEYGIEAEGLTDKEKIEILRKIISHHKVDKDLEDLLYSKIPASEKTVETRTEFVNKINNLDLRIINATGHIALIRVIQKEERKLKRKQAFQKILGISKK